MNTPQEDSQPIPAAGRERVVRVFVSSTFRDLVEDRNELMAQTWPALRRRCRERAYEPSRKWRVTQLMIVCITLLLLLLPSMAGAEAAVTTNRPVQVVIIDKVDESDTGQQQAKSEHGEIIAEILRQEG